MTKATSKNVIIIGAGPAGLTAGFEFIEKSEIKPLIYEKENHIGGLSRTEKIDDYKIDIGPHRFFSKKQEVINWWTHIISFPTSDHKTKESNISVKHQDARKDNSDLLILKRLSRIYYKGKFFTYPVRLTLDALFKMGLIAAIRVGIHYFFPMCFKRKENSLEDFYINRFGKALYQMFFKNYTQKVWGIHPSDLSPDWGSQRVKNISLLSVFKNNKQTQFYECFLYPRYGAGYIWEKTARIIESRGGLIYRNQKLTRINVSGNQVTSVVFTNNVTEERIPCDYLLSSMPLSELITSLEGISIPEEIYEIALRLPYRSHITIGVVAKRFIPGKYRKTSKESIHIPEHWIYIQEENVRMGRIFIMNNFSSETLKNSNNEVLVGVEYFCNENDDLWQLTKDDFIDLAINELEKIDFIKRQDVIRTFQIKEKKAYPAYHGSYFNIDKVISFLNTIENLYCIGRNGQHRYNNIDHSILTAMEAVNLILKEEKTDKTALWQINTEKDYHEMK